MTNFSTVVVNGPTTLLGNLNFGDNGKFGSVLYGDYRGKGVGDWRFTAGHDEQKIVFQNSINEAILTIDTETGQIIFDGSVASGTESLIANTTLNSDDGEYIFCNATSAGFTVTLPLAALSAGKQYSFVKTDSTSNIVTIDGAGSETINGSATTTLTTQYQTVTLACNGTAWYRLGSATDISAITLNVNNLITLSGVAANATSLGTFTGTTIPDNQTNKQALQALETSLESAIAVNTTQTSNITTANTNIATQTTRVDNLVTLSGVANNATNLGTFTGSTIADNQTVKAALQSLETAVESAGGTPGVGSTITTNTTLTTSSAQYQPCSSASGNITITLPAVASSAGKEFTFLRTNTSANTITIDAAGTETIEGATTSIMRFIDERLTIWCDGTKWIKKEHYARGTWTPILAGSITAGAHTYDSTNSGYFIRDKNRLYIECNLELDALDAAMAGSAEIRGLPIVSKSSVSGEYSGRYYSLTLGVVLLMTGANLPWTVYVETGSDHIELRYILTGGGSGTFGVADFTNTTRINCAGWYEIAN